MDKLCKFNGISRSLKYKLINKGVLNKNVSVDVNFLKLRGYYMDSAIFAREYHWFNNRGMDISNKQFTVMDRDAFLNFLNVNDYLLPLQSLYELAGIHTTDVMEYIIKQNITPVHHQSMSDKNSLFATGCYYYTKHLLPIVENIYACKDFEDVTIYHTHSEEDSKRMMKGIDIIHPEGEDGYNRSFKLYEKQCKEALSITPVEVKLTYDNLNYEKIDLRKIYTTKNFKDFLKLCNCFDKDPLINFMTGDGSEQSLKAQCKVAAKLPSIQNTPYIQGTPVQVQQPKKTKTVAENKEDYNLFYKEFINDGERIGTLSPEFKGKSLLFTLDHINRYKISILNILSKEEIPESYINGCIEYAKTFNTSKEREKVIVNRGLVASDIKYEEDKKLFSDEFFEIDNQERNLPKLSLTLPHNSLIGDMRGYGILPSILPRKEFVENFVKEMDEVIESERHEYLRVPFTDIHKLLHIEQNEKFYYKGEYITFKELVSNHCDIPVTEFDTCRLPSPSTISGVIKGLSTAIDESEEYEKELKKAEKRAKHEKLLRDNKQKLSLERYQIHLAEVADGANGDWIIDGYDPIKRVNIEIGIISCEIEDAVDSGDEALANSIKPLLYLLKSFAFFLTKNHLPSNDVEYNEMLLNHEE